MSFNRVGEIIFIEGNMNAKPYIDMLQDNLYNNDLKLFLISGHYFINYLI